MSPRRLRVLVAEDETLIACAIEDELARRGHAVVLACDGQEALDLAWRAEPFDVLVTDLRMPRLGGDDLVRLLRAERPDLPVVVVSAHGPSAVTDDLLRAPGGGPLSVLAKPVEFGRLAEETERVAAAGGARSMTRTP